MAFDELEVRKRVAASFSEAQGAWQAWMDEAKTDFEMAMGKQWLDKDLQKLLNKDLPQLVINLILKQVNVVSGIQRQNKTDLKVYPIEGGDEEICEVFTQTIKWIMTDRNAEFTISDAFTDALKCGLSWIHPYMSFDEDNINGDVIVKKLSPFDILPDPHFVERDLSDCDYIIRHKRVSKQNLKRLYPQIADKVDDLTGTPYTQDFSQDIVVPNDKGEKLLVVEYWYRKYEKVTYLVNSQDQNDVDRWTENKKKLKTFLASNPQFYAIEREVATIKLDVVIEDKLVAFSGDSHYGGNEYPFIPIFCFYTSAYSDWKWKLFGIVRQLKDIQREKNKRRSIIMQAAGMMPHSYWEVEEGSVDDYGQLAKSAGIGKIVKFKPGRQPPQAKPGPEIPQSLILLEQMNDTDAYAVGSNPDLMGAMMEKGAPGVAIQLRQKQGLTVLQEVFDSHSFAMRMLGRKLIYFIANNFTQTKVKRILGEDFQYTKKLMTLSQQLQEAMNMQPQPVEFPSPVSESDEMAFQMSSDGAKQVLSQQKLSQKNAMEQSYLQAQSADIQARILNLQQQIQITQQQESAFWAKFETMKREARFDCTVDETTNSPTYRYAQLSMLQERDKYRQDVPFEIMIDFMDLSMETKNKWLDIYKQGQAQMQQMQQQMMQQKGQAIQNSSQRNYGSVQ